MPVFLPNPRRRGRVPAPKTIQSITLAAPIGGINAAAPIAAMPASDCLYLINMIPYQYGLRVRAGYQEHCVNIGIR